MRWNRGLVAALLFGGLLAAGCGAKAAGGAGSGPPEVSVTVTDAGFLPETIELKAGERVRLKVGNQGSQFHHLVVDANMPATMESGAEGMLDMSNMNHATMALGQVNAMAEPGKSGEVVFTPREPGTFEISCAVAGHKERGKLVIK